RRRQSRRGARARAPADPRAGGARVRPFRRRSRARGARAHACPRMTSRGPLALALGGATYPAAWAFGSKPLYPVAIGLVAAVLLARLWTRLAGRPVELRRRLPGGERFAGDDVHVRLELVSPQRLPAAV